jgi:hypothetical protein
MKHGLNGKLLPINGKSPNPPPNAQLNGNAPTPNGAKPQLNGKPKPPNVPNPLPNPLNELNPVDVAANVDAEVAEIPPPPITAADADTLDAMSRTTSIDSTAIFLILIQSPLLDTHI